MQPTRNLVRYRLQVPVLFSWVDAQGNPRRAEGLARDLSAGGVYLLVRSCPPVGSPIQFEAFLPPMAPEAPSLRMEGQGRVLRVETGAEGNGHRGYGFAAVNTSVVLRDME